MKFTEVFRKLAKTNKRFVIQQGGTRSSKTYSMLQYLLILAQQKHNKSTIISIVAESFPHLERGAMRDFFKILNEEGVYQEKNHNKSKHSYQIGNVTIEFFSVDDDKKVRGASRDYLFENECNNISYQTHSQLAPRTTKRIFLDYNPVSEFWVHDKIINTRKGEFDYIHSTYKDNEYLSPEQIREIEARKGTDPNWWKVFGLGEIGSLEGVIFTNWQRTKELPKEAKFICYGQDFGYSNDPTTLIGIYKYNNEIYVDEKLYRTGLTNQDIVREYERLQIDKYADIFADSSEPKSIEEIYRNHYNIKPVKKGKDSILFGIDILKQYKLYITEKSLNLIKELRMYQWDKDKDGNALNKPIDNWNHCIDALRYGAMEKLNKNQETNLELSSDYQDIPQMEMQGILDKRF